MTAATHPPPPAQPPATQGLLARVLRSSVITIGGYGASQVLRLASNLVLTRLLFPEAFGMMALISVFLMALTMFSDIGLGPAIMGSKRGDERVFLDTAWAIQIVRGALLWIAALVLTWPVAQFYGEPDLLYYLPVAAFGMVIAGFNTTRRETANRHLLAGRVTLIDLGAQVVALVAGVALAWVTGSIWSLVFSGLLGNVATLILSDLFLPGPRDRWHWEPSAAQELIHFGKWIFFATVMGFAIGQADKVVLGRMLDLRSFGQFNIAYFLSSFPLMLGAMVMRRVLIPVYRASPPLADPANFRRIRKLRAVAGLFLIVLLAIISFIGDWLVGVMYDADYHAAGGMVVLMAALQVPSILILTCDQAALAAGDSRRFFHFTTIRAVLITVGLLVGWYGGGLIGALVGQGLANLAAYPALVWLLRPHGAWDGKLDLVLGVAGTAVCLLGLWLNLDAVAGLGHH